MSWHCKIGRATALHLHLLIRCQMPGKLGCLQGGMGCPELPFGFCPRLWDLQHIPGTEEDDAAIYSEALARRRHWPRWLIIVRVHALACKVSMCSNISLPDQPVQYCTGRAAF